MRVENLIHKARERVHGLRGGRSASRDDLGAGVLAGHCLLWLSPGEMGEL